MAQPIYYKGRIYEGKVNRDEGVPVQGQHNFRDGDNVTGRYELKYQEKTHSDKYKFISKELYDLTVEDFRRTVAVPLPSAGELELKNIEAYSFDEGICQPIEASTGEQFKKFSLLKDVHSVTSTDTIASAVKGKEESKGNELMLEIVKKIMDCSIISKLAKKTVIEIITDTFKNQ